VTPDRAEKPIPDQKIIDLIDNMDPDGGE